MSGKNELRLRRSWGQTTVWLVLLCVLLACLRAYSEEAVFTESHLKALFLVKFARYVDWPANAYSGTNSPITIGVMGRDEFGDDLPQAISGQTVKGRGFVIKHLTANDELSGCQILFISDSESSHIDKILARTGSLPILTVGEDKAFAQNNGIIDFLHKGDNIRLEINLTTANQAGLKISSRLLSVADVVKGKTN
jgi:hypothetical protein